MRILPLLLAAGLSLAAYGWKNGAIWYDTNGHVVNAHGGGVLAHEGKYYLYGEHKIYGVRGWHAHEGVHMYSSTDLENWTDEGIVLPVDDKPGSPLEDGCILERPKILFCEKTGKFVMFFHLELKGKGYDAAHVGIAQADKVTGPYKFIRSFRPDAKKFPIEIPEAERTGATIRKNLMAPWRGNTNEIVKLWGAYFEGGQMSRDQTVFKDDDGKAYHVRSAENNGTLNISELTDDYLDFTGRWTRAGVHACTEAPAVCKKDGWYFLLGSGCTGWSPNPAHAYRARSMMGPWERLDNPVHGVNPANGLGPEKTWGAQSNYILKTFDGKFIAMFDIWNPKNFVDCRLVWLPIEFPDGNKISITWKDEHSL